MVIAALSFMLTLLCAATFLAIAIGDREFSGRWALGTCGCALLFVLSCVTGF